MFRKLLLYQSPAQLPQHLVFVLDGNGEHYQSAS